MKLIRKTGTALSLAKFWFASAPQRSGGGPRSLVDLVFRHRGVAPIQVQSELVQFASLVQEKRPRAFLEIGTRNGGTFFVLSRLSDPRAIVMSLDLPGGRFGGGYRRYFVPIFHRMKGPEQRLHLLRADSHDRETPKQVARVLGGERLDVLFIDGDHTYEGVRSDFEMYSPFVKPGGIVAFHDIVEGRQELVGEVARFWSEVKRLYPHREIVESREQPWGGIGLLFL